MLNLPYLTLLCEIFGGLRTVQRPAIQQFRKCSPCSLGRVGPVAVLNLSMIASLLIDRVFGIGIDLFVVRRSIHEMQLFYVVYIRSTFRPCQMLV